jgi:glycerophosphoryl diester phosphodiesterase
MQPVQSVESKVHKLQRFARMTNPADKVGEVEGRWCVLEGNRIFISRYIEPTQALAEHEANRKDIIMQALLLLCLLFPVKDEAVYSKKPINIAHRGASAYAPEHTLAAYRLALEMGADFVEPDLQITKDGVLICMHDPMLERTTNAKELFPNRSREYKGKPHWFASDFTLEEIKQLDAGKWFDAKFAGEKVPTLQEMIDTVRGKAGIIPETKLPEMYAKVGLDMEKLLIEFLRKNQLDKRGAEAKTPVVIQSFSKASLVKLRKEYQCELPMVLLFGKTEPETFSVENLKALRKEVEGIGPSKKLLAEVPELVKNAQAAGLSVTIYTCRSKDVEGFADVKTEMKHYLKMGVDAIFTDNPDQFPK